jgi:hypothetical protein
MYRSSPGEHVVRDPYHSRPAVAIRMTYGNSVLIV